MFLAAILVLPMAQCASTTAVTTINLDTAKENDTPSLYEELAQAKLPDGIFSSAQYTLSYQDEGGRLCLYDVNGNYLRTITSLGMGQQDCLTIIDCQIDEATETIYVLDWKQIKKYRVDGTFLGAFKVVLADGMTLLPNELILLHHQLLDDTIVGTEKTPLKSYVFYNSLGQELASYPNPLQFDRTQAPRSALSDFVSYSFEGNTYVKNRSDTLFCVQDSLLIPAYTFTGTQTLSQISNLSWETYLDSYRMTQMVETASTLLFETQDKQGEIRQWHFDKKKRRLYFSTNISAATPKALYGTPSTLKPSSGKPATWRREIGGAPFTMIGVPSGMYVRPIDEEQASSQTTDVYLNSYYIGETEVTHAQWKAVMGKYQARYDNNNDQQPVVWVSWLEVRQFIVKLNQLSGRKFRLPTEAEWEYAAGGVQKYLSAWSGTDDINKLSLYACIERSPLLPVRSRRPNALGIYDMTGNVMEWCSDWDNPYPQVAQLENPYGGNKGVIRIFKGGSFLHKAEDARITQRGGMFMGVGVGFGMLGFRLAMDVQ